MSKKQFKSQASSSRVVPSLGNASGGSPGPIFGSASSSLSYLAEQPDLSHIDDPNLVVNFKNLAKKDGTTKAKALDDMQVSIQQLVSSSKTVDDGILSAWCKVYPRLTIDISRRVRQLAQQLHSDIFAACGKRTMKYMPAISGPWLAGIYDGDKSVMKATAHGFKAVFPTLEKQQNVVRVFQRSILEFCRNSIVNETPQTLSDERSVTDEDSQAKYVRLIASTFSLIEYLIRTLSDAEKKKCSEVYEEIMMSEKTWEFISAKDPSVRRSVFRLIRTSLDQQDSLISVSIEYIGNAFMSKKAMKGQNGSALEYSESLRVLTSIYPTLWTRAAHAKTTALSRFIYLAQVGSHGAVPRYWSNISEIFGLIPTQEISNDLETSKQILAAVHDGISAKDELRTNAEYAWGCYFNIARRLWQRLDDDGEKNALASSVLAPLLEEYIFPQAKSSHWTIPGSRAVYILSSYMQDSMIYSAAATQLPQLAERLLKNIETSLPEQSQNYEVSQKSVSSQGMRWFALQNRVCSTSKALSYENEIWSCAQSIISGSILVLTNRNGKPFGAAGVIKAALENLGPKLHEHPVISELLSTFIVKDLPSLLESPSQENLVSIIYHSTESPTFSEAWAACLNNILTIPEDTVKVAILRDFLVSYSLPPEFNFPRESESLQSLIVEQIKLAITGQIDWHFISALLKAKTQMFSISTMEQFLADLSDALEKEEVATNALNGLNLVVNQGHKLLKENLNPSVGAKLLQDLLVMPAAQEDESEAQMASRIRHYIEEIMIEQDPNNSSEGSVLQVIQGSLVDARIDSLSVNTLVNLATKCLQSSSSQHVTLIKLLPDPAIWRDSLKSPLGQHIPKSLAITDKLGGTVYLVQETLQESSSDATGLDRDGFSSVYRMALYTYRLLAASKSPGDLNETEVSIYCELMLLSLQAISDNVGLLGVNNIFVPHPDILDGDLLSFLSSAHSMLKLSTEDGSASQDESGYLITPAVFSHIEKCLWSSLIDYSPESVQKARVFVSYVSERFETRQPSHMLSTSLEEQLKPLKKTNKFLSLATFVAAYKIPLSGTQTYTRMCNEIVADLTASSLSKDLSSILEQLVLLNIIISDDDLVASTVAKQRLIFFFKHVVPWLSKDEAGEDIKSELFKTLTILLPKLSDLYGSHWSELIDSILNSWVEISQTPSSALDSAVPLLHSSLKLLETLGTLGSKEESNEDLQEAWKDSRDPIIKALHAIFQHAGGAPDEHNQPLKIVNELLARQIKRLPLKGMENKEKFYTLLNSQSRAIQRTAFDLLHEQIPKDQERISLDVALEKSTARLSEELLSLVIDAPRSLPPEQIDLVRSIPLPLLGYLSSWILVFDHFKNSSDKVKSDYIEHLKEGDYLDCLLSFTFEFLGHSRGRPIDVSKFSIQEYRFDEEQSPVKDLQWLLTHLYFLCLSHVPSLTKSWWMECRSRQVIVNVELWTEKYISPYVIHNALEAVSRWGEAQEDSASEDNLVIKANQRGKEVIISKEIDDQLLTLAIKLPPNFPLGQAVPHGVNRVAVDEKRWRSWQLNTQGVINFSNNSLVEGIVAFRRNVMGALKGQTECAICYSIVGADKQLPTKKCGTCKNLFHGSCLYRWFKSSNSSSCPLCRNAFNYT